MTDPKNSTLDIDDLGACVVVSTDDGNAHVIPKALIEDWISGKQNIIDTDDWQAILSTILAEWLDNL